MKRFFCTRCSKLRRAHVLPRGTSNPDSTVAMNRRGECTWHTARSSSAIRRRAELEHDRRIAMDGGRPR